MKKTLSLILTFTFILTLFSCMSGLPVYAIDNTPALSEVVFENIYTEETAKHIEAKTDITEPEETADETKTPGYTTESPIISKSTTAGAKNATSGMYEYSISNTEAVITKCDNSISGNITIPSTLGGYTVTKIDWGAFSGCTQIESVTIPGCIKSIEGYAFADCTSLKTVTILPGLISIGWCAFSFCTNLESISIPDSVISIADGSFDDTAWYDSQPNGLVYIGKVAYKYKGSYPKDIVIKNGTLGIAGLAFFSGNGLKADSITIPASVINIENNAFMHHNFKIKCYKDTYAHDFAKNNSIDYILLECKTHSFSSWIITITPSCTTKGEEYRICNTCGYIQIQEIEPRHPVATVVIENVVSPTCTVRSSYDEVTYCDVCKAEISRKTTYGLPLEHNYIETLTVPTCIEQGYTTYTCSLCKYSYKDNYVDALGHNYTNTVVQPTCLEQGYTVHTCTRCQHSYKDTYVSAKGHRPSKAVKENEVVATCTEKSSYDSIVYCAVCKAEISRVLTHDDALGHDWDDKWENDENGHWHKCTRCGNDSEHISHNYIEGLDNVCEDCGSYAVVKGKKAKPGGTVTITVALKNAPETTSLSIGYLSYDKDNLTFVSAKWLPADSALKSWNKTNSNGVIGFENATDLNGDVLELTFNVKENAPEGEYTVSAESLYVANEEKVNLPTVSGIVNVKNYIVGDTNGDEVITDRDAIYLLFSYYFPDKYPVEQPCDFNNDGDVTDQDAIYLLFHYYFPDSYPLFDTNAS